MLGADQKAEHLTARTIFKPIFSSVIKEEF